MILRIASQLIGSTVGIFGSFPVTELFFAIGEPGEGNSLFFIKFYGLVETFFGFLEVFESEISGALVMIVDGIFGFEFNCSVVLLNCFFVLFDFVISCSQISMVGRNSRFNLDGFLGQFNFLVVLLHFA